MQFDEGHLQLVLTVMAIMSGFYQLVKIETRIYAKIDKLQLDFNVYVAQNAGEIKAITKDIRFLVSSAKGKN